jgi:hypothetical protein
VTTDYPTFQKGDRLPAAVVNQMTADINALQAGGGTIWRIDNTGVAAGTYSSVTVNGKGQVTGGTNPGYLTSAVTTLNGLSSAITLAQGANISLATAGNTITISASGGGAGMNGVGTIAALKAASVSGVVSGDPIMLRGYYADADGGGGLFLWNATSTTADNGGTVIQVTGVATGRWIRFVPNGSPLNARWFGAKGDNTGDDKAALQRWLDAGGGDLPAGTYKVLGTLYPPANARMQGVGRASGIFLGLANGTAVVPIIDVLPTATDVVLADFTVDGNGTTSGSNLAAPANVAGSYGGTPPAGCGIIVQAYRTRIDGVHVRFCYDNGIFVSKMNATTGVADRGEPKQVILTNIVGWYNAVGTKGGSCIDVGSGTDCIVSDCTDYGSAVAFQADIGAGANATWTNCRSFFPTYWGLDGGGNPQGGIGWYVGDANNHFTNCTVSFAPRRGWWIDAYSENCSFTNCGAYVSSQQGWYINASKLSFDACVSKDSSYGNSGVYDAWVFDNNIAAQSQISMVGCRTIGTTHRYAVGIIASNGTTASIFPADQHVAGTTGRFAPGLGSVGFPVADVAGAAPINAPSFTGNVSIPAALNVGTINGSQSGYLPINVNGRWQVSIEDGGASMDSRVILAGGVGKASVAAWKGSGTRVDLDLITEGAGSQVNIARTTVSGTATIGAVATQTISAPSTPLALNVAGRWHVSVEDSGSAIDSRIILSGGTGQATVAAWRGAGTRVDLNLTTEGAGSQVNMARATVSGALTVSSITGSSAPGGAGSLVFSTVNGGAFEVADSGVAINNRIVAKGNATGTPPQLVAVGATNLGGALVPSGTGLWTTVTPAGTDSSTAIATTAFVRACSRKEYKLSIPYTREAASKIVARWAVTVAGSLVPGAGSATPAGWSASVATNPGATWTIQLRKNGAATGFQVAVSTGGAVTWTNPGSTVTVAAGDILDWFQAAGSTPSNTTTGDEVNAEITVVQT